MNFVLVHRAWLRAWCWDAVAENLRKQSRKVIVAQLPEHGNDRAPLSNISLDAYVKTVSLNTGAGQRGMLRQNSGAYMKTSQDRAVTPKMQALTLEHTPCDSVFSIEASHTPFLSHPAELAQILLHGASGQREQAKGA